MDQSALQNLVQSAQASGHQVVIQCLPKTGSTSVAAALRREGAVHELEMNAVLSLARLRLRANFQQQRRQWLKARQERLQGRVDVCTALALVIADLDDRQINAMGLTRLRLNRSLRPWLHSIVNWSFAHSGNAYKQGWNNAYRTFVASIDRTLAERMPHELGDLPQMLQFWIPVWLAYQQALTNTEPAEHRTILTDSLRLDIHANSSTFSHDYDAAFSALVPDLPNLSDNDQQNQSVSQDIHQWWLSRHPQVSHD